MVQAMIFFSAHGVPVSYVEDAGDPYKEQMEECVGLIMNELRSRQIKNDHTLAYQVVTAARSCLIIKLHVVLFYSGLLCR